MCVYCIHLYITVENREAHYNTQQCESLIIITIQNTNKNKYSSINKHLNIISFFTDYTLHSHVSAILANRAHEYNKFIP